MPVAELQAAGAVLTNLKSAFDIAKTMLGLRDAELMRQQAVELQGHILSAQSDALTARMAQAALIDEVDDLKRQVAQLKEWGREKEKYDLSQIAPGVFAYTLKPEHSGSAPPHYLCTNCFDHGQKAVLQREVEYVGRVVIERCPSCRAEMVTSGVRHAPVSPVVSTARRR